MVDFVSADPFKCRMWALHQRLDEQITEQTCRAEIESFSRHGQMVPVLGRRLEGDSEYHIELIYGARRLFIARHLNRSLFVEVRELTDTQAIVAMDIENRQRQDISPYERGLSYSQWLRRKYFRTQEEIARALNVSASQVSRLITLARLPSVIVAAFPSSSEICEGWGLELFGAWQDPSKKEAVTRKAREMAAAAKKLPAKDVYGQLIAAAAHARRPRVSSHDEVITGRNGEPLFRVRHQRDSVALVLPLARLPARSLDEIRAAVTRILQGAIPQGLESKGSGKLIAQSKGITRNIASSSPSPSTPGAHIPCDAVPCRHQTVL